VRRLLLALASTLSLCGCSEEIAGSPVEAERDIFERERVFDETALEGDSGVRKILVENYGLLSVEISRIDCPADQEVKPGNVFECLVDIAGEELVVTITVLDDEGRYEVSTPEPR
jgi:Domain of unknown function (DUF4333)